MELLLLLLLLLSFFLFLTETFVLNLYNFNIAENVDIVGTAFYKKCAYLQNFQLKRFWKYYICFQIIFWETFNLNSFTKDWSVMKSLLNNICDDIWRKTVFFLSASDYVIMFISDLIFYFFLRFEAIMSY